MEINVTKKKEHKFFPEIGDNLRLPEKERFCIVMKKQHSLIVRTGSMAKGKFDPIDYAKEVIERIENPPQLIVDGKKQDMTIDDIFKYEELEKLSIDIFNACYDVQNKDGIDLKK